MSLDRASRSKPYSNSAALGAQLNERGVAKGIPWREWQELRDRTLEGTE
jgi:hypothetical protein